MLFAWRRLSVSQYGKQLYINFQEAMRRTEATYDWSSLSSSSMKSGSSSSSLPGLSFCFYIIVWSQTEKVTPWTKSSTMLICVCLFVCVTITQSPSPITPANQTAAYQKWRHQATPDLRVLSAPSSLMPGGEERKERCECTNNTNERAPIISCHTVFPVSNIPPITPPGFLAEVKGKGTYTGSSLCGRQRRRRRR